MDEPSRHPAVAALEGRIPRPGIDLGYRLGLMLVAISMVLLPLIYIALILAVGYGLYIYVRVGPGWVGSFPIGGFWRLVGLVSPEADLSIRAADFGLEKAHVRAADRVIVDAQAEVARVVPDIDAYLEAAANWLAAALRLLAHPRGREAVARAGLVDRDIQPLLEALACLRKAHGQFLEVRETYIALTVFLQSVGAVIPAGPGVEKLNELTLQLRPDCGTSRSGSTHPTPSSTSEDRSPFGITS